MRSLIVLLALPVICAGNCVAQESPGEALGCQVVGDAGSCPEAPPPEHYDNERAPSFGFGETYPEPPFAITEETPIIGPVFEHCVIVLANNSESLVSACRMTVEGAYLHCLLQSVGDGDRASRCASARDEQLELCGLIPDIMSDMVEVCADQDMQLSLYPLL
ncbi:MAG: hypothetical protein U0136_06435 [Bdellovibrionota bacterium]